jgi:hypothetical protein
VFALQPWQAWEQFGAIYEALVVNCYLYLQISEVKLSALYPGCVTNGCEMVVQLLPAQVLNAKLPVDSAKVRCDWTVENWYNSSENCFIVVNCDSGPGWDYMFSLIDNSSKEPVLIKNQRKKTHQTMGVSTLSALREKAVTGCPKKTQLTPSCSHEVVSIFSLAVDSEPSSEKLDWGTVYLSRPHTAVYHGSLKFHPAASPFLNLNYANLTAIVSNLFAGNEVKRSAAAQCIIKFRNESSKLYTVQEYRDHINQNGYTEVQFGDWIR